MPQSFNARRTSVLELWAVAVVAAALPGAVARACAQFKHTSHRTQHSDPATDGLWVPFLPQPDVLYAVLSTCVLARKVFQVGRKPSAGAPCPLQIPELPVRPTDIQPPKYMSGFHPVVLSLSWYKWPFRLRAYGKWKKSMVEMV